MIEVVFFARLREELGTARLQIDEQTLSLLELTSMLAAKNSTWHTAFAKDLLVAVNQDMVSEDILLHDGDEVAYFPPVTGG